MTGRTRVTIVCSPCRRVGKTLLARLVVEFLALGGAEPVAFETATEGPRLSDYLPGATRPAAIGDVRSQMAFIDRLVAPDGAPKVVDVAHQTYAAFFDLVAKLGVAGEAGRQVIRPLILFVTSADAAAVGAYAELSARLPGATIVPVHNEGIAAGRRTRPLYPSRSPASAALQIPALDAAARAMVDAGGFSFAAFQTAQRPPAAAETAARLDAWIRRVFIELREFELRLLLDDLRGSLAATA